ncbi:MAG TPA: cupredoxin domain-containing protein, partial [Gemmatimonadales bacterium]
IGWWLIGFGQYVRIRVAPRDTLDVYVTAKQWMWKFAYADGHRTISTLYVPAGRPVKVILTARDVIHSFYVPDFRIKQDVIPGRYTTAWFTVDAPGTHQILCAEYCGTGHSRMRGEVVALAPADYARWLEAAPALSEQRGADEQSPGFDEGVAAGEPRDLAASGRRAASARGCLRCHTIDGAPHIGPTWAGLFGAIVPLADGRAARADEAFLTESMMDPLVKVHRGFPPVMPTYQGLLPAPEAAAIVAFIKSLGNVRPAAFTAPLPAGPLPIAPVREGTEPGFAAEPQPAPAGPPPTGAAPAGGGNP